MPSRPIINLPKTLQDFPYHHYFTGVFGKISLDQVNLASMPICIDTRMAPLFSLKRESGLIELAFDNILFVHTMLSTSRDYIYPYSTNFLCRNNVQLLACLLLYQTFVTKPFFRNFVLF